MDPSASISELEGENIFLFGFISSSVSIEVSCHMHYCFSEKSRLRQKLYTRADQKKIKRSLKEYVT